MILTNEENLQLTKLLEFILDEIWVAELDLKDFPSVIGLEKEEVKEALKNQSIESGIIINLLISIEGYPFNKKYEKKCDEIKDSCQFFLDKIGS
jgi:hypothetical protein